MANEQEIGKLVIRLVAEVSDLKKGLQEATAQIKTTADQGEKNASSLSGTIAGIKTSYLAMAAGVYSAYQTFLKAFQFAEIGSRAEAIAESFGYVTNSVGVSGNQLVSEIKDVSKVYVDNTDLMLSANKLLVAGIPAQDVVKLFESARVGARLMGTTVEESMELITRAVLTFQARGLIRQAFPMEVAKVFDKYAEGIHEDSDMMSTFGKQMAMTQEILKQTQDRVKIMGDLTIPNHYESIQRLKSAYMATKIEIGKFIAEGLDVLMPYLEKMIPLIQTIQENLDKWPGAFKKFIKDVAIGGIPFFGQIMYQLQTMKGMQEPPGDLKALEKAMADETTAVEAGLKSQSDARDKSKIDEENKLKAMTKLRMDAEKARVDAAGQIDMMGLQDQHNKLVTEYLRLGQDTFEIDQKFARDRADMELKNTLASLKAQENAEVANAVSEKKTREIPTIKAKIREQEKVAQAKHDEEVSKLTVDTTKKTIERELALDESATKTEMSNKQALLDKTEDLYNRSLVSASTYYNTRNDLLMAIGTDEIRMLQKQMDAEGNLEKKEELRTQIVEKANELEKNLTNNKLEGYKATQTEIQGQTDILQSYIARQEVMISMQRQNFEISQADALKQQITLQGDLLAALQEQLSLIDRTTDPKKYSDQLLAIEQVRAKVQDLNLQLKEQVGTFGEGFTRGIKEWSDSVKTNFQIARDYAKDSFKAIGDSFESLVTDVLTGKFKGWQSVWQSLLNDMVKAFAKSLRSMAESFISDFLKQITGKATGTSGGTSSLGGLLGGLLKSLGNSIFGGGGITGSISNFSGTTSSFAETSWTPGADYWNFGAGNFQKGGKITGPQGTDVVPIRATAGEFMQPVHTVQHYSESVMEAIRQEAIPRSLLLPFAKGYAEGGPITPATQKNSFSNSVSVGPISVNDPRLGSHLRSSIEEVVVRVLREYSR